MALICESRPICSILNYKQRPEQLRRVYTYLAFCWHSVGRHLSCRLHTGSEDRGYRLGQAMASIAVQGSAGKALKCHKRRIPESTGSSVEFLLSGKEIWAEFGSNQMNAFYSVENFLIHSLRWHCNATAEPQRRRYYS